ncbi:hypothetical protein DBV15_01521 [Temnothorax longispinosus]|uniref:Uncharacterized protein n=1 Tax=Temnothorax longispinosus TaxID=300112 RepID=A0A4S2KU84_9HYME|nr:hypothetical protein DBV15_01521 [Temnothorax longispinosus]
MAVTDIIGFSFFIILPGCLPDLLSLVTTEPSPRPHRVISRKEVLPLPPCPSLPRSSSKLLLLVSIWYGCSLHFFGSFVIDRATGCLTILQQKEKSGFQGVGRDNDEREPTKKSFTESYCDLESHGIHRQADLFMIPISNARRYLFDSITDQKVGPSLPRSYLYD